MKILVLGGTRFFGIHMVNSLIKKGHNVTIATRGRAEDYYGDNVKRIVYDRENEESCKRAFQNEYYDAVIDMIAYNSNDIKRISGAISCRRYILMSSTAVYDKLHTDTKENEFVPVASLDMLRWCERADTDYGEGKRNAERAVVKLMPDVSAVFVRYPYVIGFDDYTKRLEFYVSHIFEEKAMNIDNLDSKISFIDSKKAGEFLAHIAEDDFEGSINGACIGNISIRKIIEYIENKTGCKAVISDEGDAAPYNKTPENSIDITRAEKTGFSFSNLNETIYKLLDKYIDTKLHMKQRMIEGKLYRGDGLPPNNLKKWMDMFNSAPRSEALTRTAYLKNMFGAMGRDCYIEAPFYCDHGFNIYIGNNFYANTGLIILDQCPVRIGDNVFIGPRVGIYCATHPIDAMVRNTLLEGGKPITIGNSVWIGGGVNICPGVSIGNNSIIGAGSVVTRDIPADVIAGGNPCRVIRKITKEDHEYWMQQMNEFQNDDLLK